MSKEWPYFYQNYPYNQIQTQSPSPGYVHYQHPYVPMPNKADQSTMVNNQTTEQNNSEENWKYSKQHPEPMALSDHFERIYEKLDKVEQEYQQVKEEIKNINPVTIENINYKIQDLNVQDLSGTLLVGLTTLSDAENLKKLLSENESVSFNDINTEDSEEPGEGSQQAENNQQNDGNIENG